MLESFNSPWQCVKEFSDNVDNTTESRKRKTPTQIGDTFEYPKSDFQKNGILEQSA